MSASAFARLLVAPIRFYQRFISPGLPATCRYYPTCSAYAVESLQEHGAFRGFWFALRRVGRCHPWHAGGMDPVPPRRERTGAIVSSPPVESAIEIPDTGAKQLASQIPSLNPPSGLPYARPATAEAPTPRSNAA